MKKSSCVLLASLVINILFISHSYSSDITKPQQSTAKTDKYTKEQEEIVLKKVDDLNKNSNLKYGEYLTKEEQLIRLEMLKKQYPIDWYQKMFDFDYSKISLFERCDGDSVTEKCNPYKIIYKLKPEQIKSLILHLDDNWYDYRMQQMVKVILGLVDYFDNEFNTKDNKSGNLVIITGTDNTFKKTLENIPKSEIKNKYRNVLQSYQIDTHCKDRQCLNFSLSELKNLKENQLILLGYGCQLEELKKNCPFNTNSDF